MFFIPIKNHRFFVMLFFVLAVFTAAVFPSGKKEEKIPMKPSQIKFEDGEYLIMGAYKGGEKFEDWHIVIRLDNEKNLGEIYWQVISASKKEPLPASYLDFNTYRYTIDLKTGSLIAAKYTVTGPNEKGDKKYSLNLDTEKSMLIADEEIWDGYETKKKRSRISIPPGFPIINPGSMYYITRFLDITGPGLVYLVEPLALKVPVPLSFSYVGKETVKTPAGEFKTKKVAMNIADPLLGKLVQPYTREAYFWFEDSPRLLVVKASGPGMEFVLEGISSVK